VSYKILTLSKIDTVQQTFYADFVLVVKWTERDLTGIESSSVDWNVVWNPKIDIKNAYTVDWVDSEFGGPTTKLNKETGEVSYVCRCKGVLAEPMELHYFPFDHQALHIQLSTKGLNSEEVLLLSEPDAPGTLNQMYMPDWKVLDAQVEEVLTDPSTSLHKHTYSELHIIIHAQRKETFYVWNVGIILFAIVSLTFTAFVIPPTNTADRLQTTLSLLFTAMAFKFIAGATLPVVAFLTPLDKFILGNFAFLYTMCIYHGFIGMIPTETAEILDPFGFVALLVMWTMGQFFTVKWVANARRLGAAAYDALHQEEYHHSTDENEHVVPVSDSEKYQELGTTVYEILAGQHETPRVRHTSIQTVLKVSTAARTASTISLMRSRSGLSALSDPDNPRSPLNPKNLSPSRPDVLTDGDLNNLAEPLLN